MLFILAHGTYFGTGTTRLEPFKPVELPVGERVSFGTSLRYFVLREKPKELLEVWPCCVLLFFYIWQSGTQIFNMFFFNGCFSSDGVSFMVKRYQFRDRMVLFL